MQFLTSLVGGSGNLYLNAALALGIVLILIMLGLWALKLVFRASTNVVRGRNKRLAVIDSLPVDGKRQLVIVRRDNVEHLIMTGGPQDLLIESSFVAELQPAAPRPLPVARRGAVAPAVPATPQRAPLPQRATEAALPQASNDEGPVRGSIERLREFGRPLGQRRPASLRHTGLMRPISRMEPGMAPASADNSARANADSVTTGRITPLGGPQDGQAFGRDRHPDDQRDEG
jgi:hypothetical protein